MISTFLRIAAVTGMTVILSACMSASIKGRSPSGEPIEFMFYTGGSALDDLIIFDGTNYFGKAAYQMDDPLGDIGFRFKDGRRVQAECSVSGKDMIGQPECKEYKVYRSNFEGIVEDSTFFRPSIF